MNLVEAKEKVRQALKENTSYDSEYEIDETGIIETDFAWYIPFMDIRSNIEDLFGVISKGKTIVKAKESSNHMIEDSFNFNVRTTGSRSTSSFKHIIGQS